METLSAKAQKAFTHTKDKQRQKEYNNRLREQERKAKRAEAAKKFDGTTPARSLQKPSNELVKKRIESEYKKELAAIDSYHEL